MEDSRKEIEKTRQKIHELVSEYGIDHQMVLDLSQILDQMLNEYMNNSRTNLESPPTKHIRITPNGYGYTIEIQNDHKNLLVGFSNSFDEAKTLALDVAKNTKRPKLNVYYLEQKLSD